MRRLGLFSLWQAVTRNHETAESGHAWGQAVTTHRVTMPPHFSMRPKQGDSTHWSMHLWLPFIVVRAPKAIFTSFPRSCLFNIYANISKEVIKYWPPQFFKTLGLCICSLSWESPPQGSSWPFLSFFPPRQMLKTHQPLSKPFPDHLV